MPGLRPTTALLLNQAAKNPEFGLKGKKDFLANKPKKIEVISKVSKYFAVLISVKVVRNIILYVHVCILRSPGQQENKSGVFCFI